MLKESFRNGGEKYFTRGFSGCAERALFATQSKRGFEVKQKALKYARFDCGPEKHCASAQRGSV